MARNSRHHYRREDQEAELDITTFLNLMVVLIPFLLVTAVFSRITIQELNLPTDAAGGSKQDRPQIAVEVILRKNKMQLSDGNKITSTIKNSAEGKYNIKKLSAKLLALKGKHQEIKEATLLIEPNIEYEDLIHVMDAVKVAEVKRKGSDEIDRVVLFPQISLGDAP
jgi:biopolymer transport protein ExbD